jgi:hypothetical protein
VSDRLPTHHLSIPDEPWRAELRLRDRYLDRKFCPACGSRDTNRRCALCVRLFQPRRHERIRRVHGCRNLLILNPKLAE